MNCRKCPFTDLLWSYLLRMDSVYADDYQQLLENLRRRKADCLDYLELIEAKTAMDTFNRLEKDIWRIWSISGVSTQQNG